MGSSSAWFFCIIGERSEANKPSRIYCAHDFCLLANEASKPSRTLRMIFLYYWRAKRANLVVLCARFFSIIYIFPGQCHTVISNLAITRIILNPFYNAAVYTAYSEPTMHCILLYIFPGQCHTVISNLAITRIILNPFYNAAVYTAYSDPTMHCAFF